jgi:RHS repeat-associated protein
VPTFGFTGELQDTTTGLVNLRARWYSTGYGRFTTRDPWEGCPTTPYSLHPYQYAYSDPALYTDPSGKCVVSLLYRYVLAGYYHVDVVVNDCDPATDCRRDPENTITVFWGGPSISDDQVSFIDKILWHLCPATFPISPWGNVVADSATYAEKKRRDPATLPDVTTLVDAMLDLQKARESQQVLTILYNSESCIRYIQAMMAFKDMVNNARIRYSPRAVNSNGVAYGYVESAGITQPSTSQHVKPLLGYIDYIYRVVSAGSEPWWSW